MNQFLLIMGFNYYPQKGTGDWIGCYCSYEKALAEVVTITINNINYYKLKSSLSFNNGKDIGERYDWFKIVNLGQWIYTKVK